MYYYIYDSYLSEKKYVSTLARIENRLTDLGINGKINRLSFLKNIRQVLEDEVKKGTKTIVVVGNDQTLNKVVNIIHDLNITIGYIPVGKNNISELLNIPEAELACDTLSARIIKNVDLGKINDEYFFTTLIAGGQQATINCDDNFFLTLENKNNYIQISKLSSSNKFDNNKLEVLICDRKRKLLKQTNKSCSRLFSKTIKITSKKPMSISIKDEAQVVKTPTTISVVPKKINIICGKGINC
jgi:diacylglycerol kinase family enzyme